MDSTEFKFGVWYLKFGSNLAKLFEMVFYFSAFRCRNLYVKEIMLFGVVLRLLNGAMLLGRLCHQNLLNIYFNFRPNKV